MIDSVSVSKVASVRAHIMGWLILNWSSLDNQDKHNILCQEQE
jgi:hypothetical protein